jgi:D-alanyl-D-alanine dipeptidase
MSKNIYKINNNITKYLIILSILFISLSACTQKAEDCGEHPNPFGLKIMHCIDDYRKDTDTLPENLLIDLQEFIPMLKLDIRYATKDNFTGEIIYTSAKAYLRTPAAEALAQVQDSLSRLGIGLIIYDAYRPYSASVRFFEVYPDTNFVANPRYGSRHNRGCAVDVALYDLTTSEPLLMPTEFDEFSEKAHPEYMDLPEEAIRNRELLFAVMSHFGFTHYPTEWWHFDFLNWDKYPLMDLSFSDLESFNLLQR